MSNTGFSYLDESEKSFPSFVRPNVVWLLNYIKELRKTLEEKCPNLNVSLMPRSLGAEDALVWTLKISGKQKVISEPISLIDFTTKFTGESVLYAEFPLESRPNGIAVNFSQHKEFESDIHRYLIGQKIQSLFYMMGNT